MSKQEKFERTVATLSEAALDDSKLVAAAAMINDLIGATGHSIAYADPGPTHVPDVLFARFFAGTERREDWESAYFGEYWRRDAGFWRLHSLEDGELAFGGDLYTDEEKRVSPVYNEFRRDTKSCDGLFTVLDGLDGCRVLWSLADSAEPGGWTGGQMDLIRRLAPHLRQFARVRRRLADAGALNASLTELLDNTRLGIIQLDRRGRILAASDRARKLLLKRDGLIDRGGELTAATPGEYAGLQRLLSRALPPYGAAGVGGSITITRRRVPEPLVLEVRPSMRGDADHRGKLGAVVLVADPAGAPGTNPALAAALLGLSPTEGRVALALAAGDPVADIARAQGCAESTVRTHLKRIYRKLGIRRQTELVRRILSLEGLRESPG